MIGKGEQGKEDRSSKGKQGRRGPRASEAILFSLEETFSVVVRPPRPAARTPPPTRSAAFGSGAVSSSDDLWCENSISVPLSSLPRSLARRCFFYSPPTAKTISPSCLSVKKRQAAVAASKTDRQRPPPSPPPAITSLLCFMANLQPMDRERGKERVGETRGQQLKSGAAAFIYIAKWPREKNDLVVGRFSCIPRLKF